MLFSVIKLKYIKRVLGLLLCFFYIFFLAASPAWSQWKQSQIVIGTFIDPSPDSTNFRTDPKYLQKIREAKDAYFNLFSGMGYKKEHYADSFLTYKYDLLAKNNISSLYLGPDLSNLQAFNADPSKLNSFVASIDSVGKSAFSGFFLIDEPRADMAGTIKNAIAELKTEFPRALGYVNLLPVYAFPNKKEYESYLDLYLNTDNKLNSLEVVSYDFYPFLNTGKLRTDYFYNLSVIRKKAVERPLWFYVNTTEHGPYSNPDNYQLNFMAFCPFAYGAKGILYFTYETIQNSATGLVFGDAILDKNHQPTYKYYIAQNINRFVRDIIGPVIMNSKYWGAYHVSNINLNEVLPSEDIVNGNMPVLSKIGNANILAGIFQRNDIRDEYNIFFVNKSNLNQNDAFVALRGNCHNKVFISHDLDSFKEGGNEFFPIKTVYDKQTNETRVYINFKPGEGRMLKIKDVSNPFEKTIIPDISELKVFPNPLKTRATVSFNVLAQKETNLIIFTLDGVQVKSYLQKAYLVPGKYYEFIDTSGIKPGNYILSLISGSQKLSQNIIIAN